jgi:hypothetical protein
VPPSSSCGAASETRSASTDSTGAFRVEGLPAGQWAVAFMHPRLELLGMQPPVRLVEVRDGQVTRGDLAIASGPSIVRASCEPAAGDSSGLVLGRVLDARSRLPVSGSLVSITWGETVIEGSRLQQVRKEQTVNADADGRFAICGVPTDVTVGVAAGKDSLVSGLVQFDVPANGLVARELLVGIAEVVATETVDRNDPSAAAVPQRRGTARLVGQVRTGGGEPFGQVVVGVHGSMSSDTTDSEGRFVLEELPPGTATFEARAIGFVPVRRPVDLVSERTDTVSVQLRDQLPVLEEVRVFGSRRAARGELADFMRRRAIGTGRYLTPADVEARQAFDATDLVRTLPGVRIVNSLFDRTVLIRDCPANVWLNGFYIQNGASDLAWLVRPVDIGAVEVYSSAVTTPVEFQRLGMSSGTGSVTEAACGTIVIWTKDRMR